MTALDESLKNVVVGRILSMEQPSRTPTICGSARLTWGRDEPVQIVTGAWNIHAGDLVPVAQHKSLLPGGVKIEKGKLRGVLSNGMLCSLKELGLTAEHDYPYAVITPAALLNDYQAPRPGQALHPRRHPARGQGVRPRGLRQGAGGARPQSYGRYHTHPGHRQRHRCS